MHLSSKLATIAVLLIVVSAAQAEARGSFGHPRATSPAWTAVPALALSAGNSELASAAVVTLPPEEKPKTHWPWWLRILAVIGVLVFIRLVAGSVRNNPGRPGPS